MNYSVTSFPSEIDYTDKKCPECGEWAFIPCLVTDICQNCWEEQKFVQYFYLSGTRNENEKRFSNLQGAI